MFVFMIILFVLGYIAIALEHPIKINKAATALILGTLTWVAYILGLPDILNQGYSSAWNGFLLANPVADHKDMIKFVGEHEVLSHLAETATIIFFLLGAMTIVEIIDQHHGFKVITDKIHTTGFTRLIWIISILTFFMSAILDNLTTTIVMVALLRKLVSDKEQKWFIAGLIILAANAGGAWSPIGDVTTIMLWIGGQVSTVNIILKVFLPSLFSMLIPLLIITFFYPKLEISRPKISLADEREFNTSAERTGILFLGLGALLFVPVFKTLTHLPPYMGMLLGLGVLWVVTEIIHRGKPHEDRRKLTVAGILTKIDVPTVLFFLGILMAVASLSSAGHLNLLSKWLDEKVGDIYVINLIIGALSSIVDNVPLVAGAMGMYDIATPEMVSAAVNPAYIQNFAQDGLFWEFLAYCAGTGGSILIIGSAAGVAAMGLEKIDFIWYLKKISWLAIIGYLSGAAVYWLQAQIV
ncbi:MAG: sodium:proton antiporter [Porphyromonadaceae bacterium]|nr:MAG: sodium:proton antiporter [Porphyromonadaceae bacterium]